MSDAVIRSANGVSPARLRLVGVGCLVTLGLVISQVPSVPALVSRWIDGEDRTLTVSGQLDAVLLTVAGVLVWLLMCWIGAVLAIAVVARLLGRSDTVAVALLQRLTPPVVHRMVISALGIGSIAALSACAPGHAVGGEPAAGSTAASTLSTTLVTELSISGPQVKLDWPIEPTPTAPTAVPEYTLPPVTSRAAPAPDPAPPLTESSTAATDVNGDLDWPVEPAGPTPEPTPGAASTAAPTATVHTQVPAADPALLPADTGTGRPATPTQTPDPPPPQEPASTPPVADASAVGPESSAPVPSDTARQSTVTVSAGDSLWSITAAHLGPTASPAEIDAGWPRLYDANRGLIADPDLIRPGWTLTIPYDLGVTSK